MQIRISARHGQLDENTQDLIREKAQKLSRFFDRLTAIQVTADMAHAESPQVELRASAEHHEDFVATDEATNVVAALDGAIHKLESQLKKHKEKVTGHRATSAKHIEAPESDEVE